MNREILRQVKNQFESGRNLPQGEAAPFFDALLAETDEALLAGILTAWENKGVVENELFEIASIMRSRCTQIKSRHEVFVDTVGTGGSRAKTFNVSTAAAFVIAGAGIPVAKHGNRAATSKSGSADVLAELGVNPVVDAALAERCLDEIGICFLFAPNFHRLSASLASARRSLGFPTIFNNLGPLCNPAKAPHQVIGVWNKNLLTRSANVLARLGTRKSWIVHGSDGLDEITLNGITFAAEINNGKVTEFEVAPADFGIADSDIASLRTSSPEESAAVIDAILNNREKNTAAENLVLINAAAAIYVGGKAENLKSAMKLARESLYSGAALRKLKLLADAAKL